MRYITTINEREYLIDILDEQHVSIDGVSCEIDFSQLDDQPVYSLLLDGKSYDAHIYLDEDSWQVMCHGSRFSVRVEDEHENQLRAAMGGGLSGQEEYHLKAPMPGLVVAVPVYEGQPIQKGDVLLILESMKMQNELRSPRAGVIARMRVRPGDRVEQKETMLSVV